MLTCANAPGQTIPPMIIYDMHNLRKKLVEEEMPGMIYRLSNKDWIDSELFCGWLTDHFVKYTKKSIPNFCY